jgi:hypothetical protein
MPPVEAVRQKPEKSTLTTGKIKSGVDVTGNINLVPASRRFRGRIKISDPAIIEEIAESDLRE